MIESWLIPTSTQVENSAVMLPMLTQLGLLERIQFQRSPIALVTNGKVQPISGFADTDSWTPARSVAEGRRAAFAVAAYLSEVCKDLG